MVQQLSPREGKDLADAAKKNETGRLSRVASGRRSSMTKQLSSGVSVLAAAVSAFGLAAIAQAAETKGPVTDDIGVVEIPKGAPIVIGGYWTLTGPDTALGLDQKRAVEVAFDEIGNEIARPSDPVHRRGRPVQRRRRPDGRDQARLDPEHRRGARARLLELGDRWRADPVERRASSTSARRRPRPRSPRPIASPTISATCGRSTATPMPANSTRKYFYEDLKCRTLATIHDGSPYAAAAGQGGRRHFPGARRRGGRRRGRHADRRRHAPGADRHRAPRSRACSTIPIFVAAAAQIMRQAPEIPDLKNTKIMGGSALLAPGFLEAAGDAAKDFAFTNVDTTA